MTVLQLAACSDQAVAGPRVVKLLLQRGASVCGSSSCKQAAVAYGCSEYWYPRAKPCSGAPAGMECMWCADPDPHQAMPEMCQCYDIAHSASTEKVMRLLLAAGARDGRAAARIASLDLDCAVREVRARAYFEKDSVEKALRHTWSDAKLNEIRVLFADAHAES